MTRHQPADVDHSLGRASVGGRYTLLRRLAVGGMAEIFLARQGAMAGFEKEVVIKRLRAELADDPRIVEMFLDEARIGALLNHPNIVHVYDVDEQDGIPYIAMEYIVGEELNELCRRGLALDKFLPLEHAVELMRQAAAGMGYFHAMRGGEGTPLFDVPLDIVHLDISPSNLLVTRDGFLKVIDFGIANAKGQRQRTDVIPGKLGYMSPEQAARASHHTGPKRPGRVDHRSDIFSLGIVMYEITVGKRLFRGPAQDVIQRIVTAQVEPPTFARRNFPSALEAIVMRTLEKHPEDRYQSAYDLADDLETFLRDERMHSGPVRIARYLDVLTTASGGPSRPELVSVPDESHPLGDELDFDSEVFQTFAPGPAQAKEWEEELQPDQEVAAALGLGLEELRALRTPVPHAENSTGPQASGFGPPLPDGAESESESASAIVPVPVPVPVPATTASESTPEPARASSPAQVPPISEPESDEDESPSPPSSTSTSTSTSTKSVEARGPRPEAPTNSASVDARGPRPEAPSNSALRPEGPVIGARLLPPAPRAGASWFLVALLLMAVLALVAYIFLT